MESPGNPRRIGWGRYRLDCAVLLFLLLVSTPVFGRPAMTRFSFDFFFGFPINLNSNLKITQEGQEDLEFTAHWKSEPFKQPLYWDIRLAYWTSESRGWALDLMHNKLILENPPNEVQGYSQTHGYNMVTVQRLWVLSGNLVSAAAGVVFAHPESTVRGQVFPETGGDIGGGYYLTGPMVGGGFGRRFGLTDLFFVSLEGRVTLSYTTTPVQGGESSLTLLGFHGLFGVGVGF